MFLNERQIEDEINEEYGVKWLQAKRVFVMMINLVFHMVVKFKLHWDDLVEIELHQLVLVMKEHHLLFIYLL